MAFIWTALSFAVHPPTPAQSPSLLPFMKAEFSFSCKFSVAMLMRITPNREHPYESNYIHINSNSSLGLPVRYI